MSIDRYYTNPKTLRRMREGPLAGYIDLFADRLHKEGHCRQSAWRNLHVVSDFSHWMARNGVPVVELDEQIVERYKRLSARYRSLLASDRPALLRFLSVLRDTGVIAHQCPKVVDSGEQIECDFERYLIEQCGLTRVSTIRHKPTVLQFLREQCGDGDRPVSLLTPADVIAFVERHAEDHSTRSAQMMCWSLRSFLRYLHYRGEISTDLTGSVPTIRRCSHASLPSFVHPDVIEQVLSTCDRRSSIGRRNYAVLMLLARLGLRANEIRTLCLEDIDWRSGQLTVQGKGRRIALMPLPVDAGGAIADYLRNGRPESDSRQVFLRHVAPNNGFASSSAISYLAKDALTRAGVAGIAHKGAHVFRHSLATHLLGAGASLTEIGQVLRHQRHDTTRTYAKVDLRSLRGIALPWPGGVR